MSHAKVAVFVALAVLTAGFVGFWVSAVRRARRENPRAGAPDKILPTLSQWLVGFVTNFFDTLGVGSFAPTTSIYKLRGMVADEHIPGTLNVGHTVPSVIQALIFIAIVAVEPKTLILMIGSAVLGAWLGAGVVANLPRRKVQIAMGSALTIAALFLLRSNLGLSTAGGTALSLDGSRLVLGMLGNFVLGATMTIGVGLFAPCMILVSLLGMDPKAAFPIMMGSCAFLMPAASTRFVRERSYALRPALGLTLGGIPAVLIAAYAVGSLDLVKVRWLVIVVVVYTAIAMLRTAQREKATHKS